MHGGVADEHVLGLARVDVHAAGDDHVRHAVGQVEVAVVVDVADVAERGPPPVVERFGVFSGPRGTRRCAPRTRSAPPRRSATRCRPRRRCARRRAAACPPSRCASHSSEPMRRSRRLRCPRSTRTRSAPATRSQLASPRAGTARRRARPLQARQVVLRAPSGSLSRRMRWVGTNCMWVTRYRSMRARHASGRSVHDDDRSAEALQGRRPAGRGRVVQRRGAEVHGSLGQAEQTDDEPANGSAAERAPDAA